MADDARMSEGGEPWCFLLSLRYRDEVTAAIAATGRQVAVARRPADAARRFEQSSALVAVIDARGAFGSGLEATRALAILVERRRAALIVLISRIDAGRLGEVLASGATHFLIGGPRHGDLAHALTFAERYVRRLHASGASASIVTAQAALASGARWEWKKGEPHVTVSPGLAALLGQPIGTERVGVAEALDHVADADREDLQRGLLRVLRGGLSGELTHKMVVDGRPHTIAHHVRAVRDSAGRLRGLSASVEDLDAVLLERRLSAHFDTLTGLANAAFAREWVEQLLGGRSDCEPAVIVLLLSLSRFDGINAGYGRQVADALLQAVARRMRRVGGADRAEDLLMARMGGATFMVAFAGPVTLSEVIALAGRLGTAFEQPFLVGGRVIHLACRIGIAVGENDLDGADTLLRRASAALAQAKAGDPNGFEVFMTAEGDDLLGRMANLEDDLRQAMDADEFDLLYQPQVDLETNRIVGVEALTRWRHPSLGLLPAQTIMDVAESAQVTPRLGEHILSKALAEAMLWPPALGHLRLAVNMTAEDMSAADFPDRVLRALGTQAFPPGRLTVEVTESGLMRDVDHAARALALLRVEGVRVAVDDFGTGYSSLAYLKALPLDYLKVDKKLVMDLFGSARDRVVVQGVVEMARSLGLVVIAEGVETEEQRSALERTGCDWYQGYLCSRPIDGRALAALVEEWNDAPVAA